MSLLKQIEDKGAVLEWSPVANHSNLVALGTKVRKFRSCVILYCKVFIISFVPLTLNLQQDSAGVGFDDYGGELELHMLDFRNNKSSSTILLGKARAK